MATMRVDIGDIAAVTTEAVVNAANNDLWMGAGVAGALKRAGGSEIEREAVGKGPIQVGEAVWTTGGRLAAKYVIHAAAMGYARGGLRLICSAETIRAATEASLRLCNELGVTSVAFPALGTGVAGFPLDECARLMVDAARRHLRGATSLRDILFVVRDPQARATFEAAIAQTA